MSEAIDKIYLPQALATKMICYTEFWNLSPNRLKPIFEAYRQSQGIINDNFWLQGQYIRAAVASCMNTKNKYPAQPFSMEKKDEQALADAAEEKFRTWCIAANIEYEKKHS